MFDKLLKDDDTFVTQGTEVYNKTLEDGKASSEMLRAFLEAKSKESSDNSDMLKTLEKIQEHAEEIQKLNEEIKKLGVSQSGGYKNIKACARDIIWSVEFIGDSL